ncbi:hypothetical protein [Gordonia spumicola]|uniref:hypothetical protein n=1 Tax=Gordonia spumicola TaxID=589161 RepID=UPI0016429AED|nr:hypothetical protein [Gordonia spumicola]
MTVFFDQLRAAGGTVWLTQAEIAQLYGQVISRVLADGEVSEETINSGVDGSPGGRQVPPGTPHGRDGPSSFQMTGSRTAPPALRRSLPWEGQPIESEQSSMKYLPADTPNDGAVPTTRRERTLLATYFSGFTVAYTARLHVVDEATFRSHYYRVANRYREPETPTTTRWLLERMMRDGWIIEDPETPEGSQSGQP